ncbi:beta-2-microglobulin-like [Narcine bancroftii]|uniref:beta-2-microglobulin-like n=1 Tax=Narcine bancroftii TaxID=1343680 RepID=UPI0038315074
MLQAFIWMSLAFLCLAKVSPPQITMYTYNTIQEGEKNVLFCYAKGFTPPNIKLELMQGNEVIPNTNHSDITFEQNWKFIYFRYIEFHPKAGEEYGCRVHHNGKMYKYKLES